MTAKRRREASSKTILDEIFGDVYAWQEEDDKAG
jgi:hypothetical protein